MDCLTPAGSLAIIAAKVGKAPCEFSNERLSDAIGRLGVGFEKGLPTQSVVRPVMNLEQKVVSFRC